VRLLILLGRLYFMIEEKGKEMSDRQEDCPSCGSSITPEDLEQYGMCPLCYSEEIFHLENLET
jgi:predicted RNA-binding Zn-ribbon protein involved in translation (DUF1610 family)